MGSVTNGKTVLITGASRGIGAAAARAFARDGYSVAINYLHSHGAATKLKCDIESRGGKAEIYRADVTDFDSVEAMVRSVVAFRTDRCACEQCGHCRASCSLRLHSQNGSAC